MMMMLMMRPLYKHSTNSGLGAGQSVVILPRIGFLVHVLAGFSKALAVSLSPPHNISVVLTSWSPPAVRVSWQFDPPTDRNGSQIPFRRFELTYRPLNARYRIVEEVQPDIRSITLERLLPSTEYQLFLATIPENGSCSISNKSKTIHFISPAEAAGRKRMLSAPASKSDSGSDPHHESFTVREEEVVIVVLVLAVWVAVILLFFNKWGKIRMLEPYQPQYRPYSQPVSVTKPARLGVSTSLSAHMLDHDFNACRTLGPAGRNRFRQNSMYVTPYNRAYSLPEPPVPRKFKSAEDINSLVVQVTSHDDETTVL